MSGDIIPNKSKAKKAAHKKTDNTPFSIRFDRVLLDSDVPSQFGAYAFSLLHYFKTQMDRTTRFERPFAKDMESLQQKLGFTRQTITKARNALIEAGWLWYEQGKKNKPSRYQLMIPGETGVSSDGAIVWLVGNDCPQIGVSISTPMGTPMGTPKEKERVHQRVQHNSCVPVVPCIPKNPSNPSAGEGGFSWKEFGDDFEQAVAKQIYDDNLKVDADKFVEWVRKNISVVRSLPLLLKSYQETKVKREQRHAGAKQSRQEAYRERSEHQAYLAATYGSDSVRRPNPPASEREQRDQAKQDAARRRAQARKNLAARNVGKPWRKIEEDIRYKNRGISEAEMQVKLDEVAKKLASGNWEWWRIEEDIRYKNRGVSEDELQAMLEDAKKQFLSRVN